MKLPNFFIIGAPKCGTTSMAAWLRAHPKIFIPSVKEPHYFNTDLDFINTHTWDAYRRLFRGASGSHQAVGEASVFYLYSKRAVPRIENEIGQSRYIVMVRNPVEMAYSMHEQQVYAGNETVEDFSRAWELSEARAMGESVSSLCREPRIIAYKDLCSMGEQLKRLYEEVPPERVLVLVLDDLREDSRREYLRVLDFLGVPDDGREEFPVHNQAKERRWPWLRRLMKKTVVRLKDRLYISPMNTGILDFINNMNKKERARKPMPEPLRAKLTNYFESDIHTLNRYVDRDLSDWLNVAEEAYA